MDILNIKKYGGKYIATESFNSNIVISYGKNPVKVHKKAIKLGFNNPVINYIFKEDEVSIFINKNI
jgi:hypothetical protein